MSSSARYKTRGGRSKAKDVYATPQTAKSSIPSEKYNWTSTKGLTTTPATNAIAKRVAVPSPLRLPSPMRTNGTSHTDPPALNLDEPRDCLKCKLSFDPSLLVQGLYCAVCLGKPSPQFRHCPVCYRDVPEAMKDQVETLPLDVQYLCFDCTKARWRPQACVYSPGIGHWVNIIQPNAWIQLTDETVATEDLLG